MAERIILSARELDFHYGHTQVSGISPWTSPSIR